MNFWIAQVDGFLKLDDRQILDSAGNISHKIAVEKAKNEYKKFNQRRTNEGLSQAEKDFLETTKKMNKK